MNFNDIVDKMDFNDIVLLYRHLKLEDELSGDFAYDKIYHDLNIDIYQPYLKNKVNRQNLVKYLDSLYEGGVEVESMLRHALSKMD